MDLSPFIGDIPVDETMRRRLDHFLGHTAPIVTAPGRWHTAGWLWSARFASLTAAVGDHAPINLITVRAGAASSEWVCQIACLIMRGTVDHIFRIGERDIAIIPTEEFYTGIRGEAPPSWFACPYGNRQRCVCMAPEPH